MRENHAWFAGQGLPAPTHYVPPAWALGRISRRQLEDLPFATVEVLRGVIDVASGRLDPMPLLGYEADTGLRSLFLRSFNAWNRMAADFTGRCARISLHPFDLTFRLKDRIPLDCQQFQLRSDLPSHRRDCSW